MCKLFFAIELISKAFTTEHLVIIMTKACTILARWTLSSSSHVVFYFFSLLQWNNTLGKHCCVSLTGRETEAQESWALPKDIDLALCNNQIKARTSGFSAWNPRPSATSPRAVYFSRLLRVRRVPCSKRSHKPELFPRLPAANCPCQVSDLP